MLNQLRRGASLLELLISLAIIGALASLTLGAAMAVLTKVHQLGGGCCFGGG
jgi:prepilin-type N-terminal cleavage/methylation domain-containing protein